VSHVPNERAALIPSDPLPRSRKPEGRGESPRSIGELALSFHGAAQGVTGSCFLLRAGGLSLLVDCGLYQGSREITEENEAPFGFDPAGIDCLLLTHAHLDHCGRIPLLVKHGFRGEIIATAATRELARLVLLDAAHLQEEEAKRTQRRPLRHDAAHAPAAVPLYTVADAVWSFERFGRTAHYDAPIALSDRVSVRFIDAGHILGSATLVVEVQAKDGARRIVFSGDLGGDGHAILRDPTRPPAADYVVMESTYGDRAHRSLSASIDELHRAIGDTLKRGGNVIIPTFALERSQEILFYLHQGVRAGRLPHWLPVFLDSPMAISATEIMRRHPECFDAETARLLGDRDDPFSLPGLRFTRETSDSMALARVKGGAIIMAGSGMCTGGRVRHHLLQHLARAQSSVIFVGFAAAGTLARRIVDGATSVQIFGETVPVRAHIHTINGFSAHADRDELIAWHAATGKPKTTFLVHGDPERGMAGLRDALVARRHTVMTPAPHAAVPLE
jgi:metallo-beta-lactamase family protein